MEGCLSNFLNLNIHANESGNVAADTPNSTEIGSEMLSVSSIPCSAFSDHSYLGGALSPLAELDSSSKALHRSHLFKSPGALSMSIQTKQVYVVVLTGGPCGGKTSAQGHISAFLEHHGFDVLSVPECPTIMIQGGCKYPGMENAGEKLIQFEVALLRLQQQLEETFMRVAVSVHKPAVLLLDRGLADPGAYLPDDLWKDILDVADFTIESIFHRYDAVLHLETVAKKAEQYYTTTNNTARSESIEEACVLDDKILAAWEGHPNLHVFDNSTDFQGKLSRIVACIGQLVGVLDEIKN